MKTLHMCISIRGILLWPKRKQAQAAKGFLVNGKPCGSRVNMVQHLLDLIAQGYEVLPLGEPCEGFDKVNGCPGHEQTEAA